MANEPSYRRHIVGVISVLLLIAAAGMYFAYGERQDQTSFYIGICVRLGLVLGSMWVAWPQVSRLANVTPKMILVGLAIILLVGVIASKKLLPLAILFVVAAIVLQLVARLIKSQKR